MNTLQHNIPYDLDLDKILIVDDLQPNRRLVTMMFRGTEFTIVEADGAADAIEKAHIEWPFLIISDVQMPEMDGYGLCEVIKNDPDTAHIAVIFVTAHHRSTDYMTRGLNIGADDYIYRPFKREELLARVRAVARLKLAEAEARRQTRIAQRRNKDLALLYQVGNALTSTLDTEMVLGKTTQLVQEFLGAEVASLWLLDDAGQNLVLTASSEVAEDDVVYTLPIDQGIAGYVARTGEAYFSADTSQDTLHHGDLVKTSDYQTRSILCVPLHLADWVIGVIQALHSEPGHFSVSDLQLFESVTSAVSIAVQNARLFEEVQVFNQQLEHKVAERTRQLEQEKEKTWAILANMADALIVIDPELRVLIANVVAEEMLNFRLAELLGRPIPEDLLDSPLWRAIEDMARSEELTMSQAVDMADPFKPDTLLSVQAHSSKMWDDMGQIGGTVIVVRDVTALKEVERMKARFMAGITHELKTPLAVIRTHANNFSTYYRRIPRRKRKDLMLAIDKQVLILEKLVGGILDLARLDAGLLLDMHPFNFVSLVGQIVDDLQPLAARKSLALQWASSAENFLVSGDAQQLARVIRNLVDNAIKYTFQGTVSVTIEPDELRHRAAVRFQVQDSGMGIPAEHLNRIFERFYRVDPSHTIPGTGLGLSIVKEIVEAHGGEMHVSSTLGQGSTFTVTLLVS